jgi:hypothetical protein
MKTASFPSLRVEPELREAAESVLRDGESLSTFIETSIRESIERRRARDEFMARGLLSREESLKTGVYHAPAEVHAELRGMLARASKRVRG